MSGVSKIDRNESVTERAKREVAEEVQAAAVQKMKGKLRELHAAETVVANIKREVADLEEAIAQGNA